MNSAFTFPVPGPWLGATLLLVAAAGCGDDTPGPFPVASGATTAPATTGAPGTSTAGMTSGTTAASTGATATSTGATGATTAASTGATGATTTGASGAMTGGSGGTTAASTGPGASTTGSDAGSGTSSGAADGGATGGDAGMTGTADAGTTGSDAGTTGDDAGTTSSGDAPGGGFPDCTWDQLDPCGTYVTAGGTRLELGPHGAQGQKNVGEGFENSVSRLETGTFCDTFGAQFSGSDPDASDRLMDISDLELALYTVYFPAAMAEGETYPLISWGNGTCAQPEGYGALLRYVASHGFVVVAPNSRFVGDGSAQRQAIDFAAAMNADANHPLYQRVDLEHVGATGHSQGAGGTQNAADDPRIDVTLSFNGEYRSSKPVFAISGDRDILPAPSDTAAGFGQSVESNNDVGAWMWFHKIPDGDGQGHITLMAEPWRVAAPTVAWFKYQLLGDAAARDYFVEPTCTLCQGDVADYEYGHNDGVQ